MVWGGDILYEGICDPDTGLCVDQLPCSPEDPFERCILNNTYKMECDSEYAVEVPVPCPGCHEIEGTMRVECD